MIRFPSSLMMCGLLTGVLAVTGCDAGSKSKTDAPDRHHVNDGHDHSTGEHSHKGPHGGHLIELGTDETAHAEMLHDDKTNRVTVYILDGKAKSKLAISQPELVINMISGSEPRQFKLAAVSQAGEMRDMASCFQLEDADLCKALDSEDAKGRLAVNINGKQYVGEIEHHEHEGDDHEHSDHKH